LIKNIFKIPVHLRQVFVQKIDTNNEVTALEEPGLYL